MSSFLRGHSLSPGNGLEGVEVDFEAVPGEEVVEGPLCSFVAVGPVFALVIYIGMYGERIFNSFHRLEPYSFLSDVERACQIGILCIEVGVEEDLLVVVVLEPVSLEGACSPFVCLYYQYLCFLLITGPQ